jgi:hypothetical protein
VLTHADCERKLERLAKEELTPLGLELLVHDLANDATRFIIKESGTGRVCGMIDCDWNAPAPAGVLDPRK